MHGINGAAWGWGLQGSSAVEGRAAPSFRNLTAHFPLRKNWPPILLTFLQEVFKGVKQVHGNCWTMESRPLDCRRARQTLPESNVLLPGTKSSWTSFLIPKYYSILFTFFCIFSHLSASFQLEIILFHLAPYHRLSWPAGTQNSLV